jgi:ketosteroid isomerase-like protein
MGGAREPQQLNEMFLKFFDSRDIEGLLSLYEEEAVSLIVAPTAPVKGRAAIKEALEGFLSSDTSMELMGQAEPIVSGDIALTHSKWRIVLQGGDPIEGVSDEVVRRGPDGEWRYLIGNPWGSTLVDVS